MNKINGKIIIGIYNIVMKPQNNWNLWNNIKYTDKKIL